MHKLAIVLALALVVPFNVKAQTPQHAPDGGTREQVIGPYISPIPGAPFSAYLVTEWTHLLPDGTVGTTKNRRLVARDSAGHVFQEHRNFAPDGDQRVTRLAWVDYVDPQQQEYYACAPGNQLCEAAPLPPARGPAGAAAPGNPAVQQGQKAGVQGRPGMPAVETQSLGEQNIESLDVVGSREITTFPQGAFGNQQAEPVIKEFWYSDRLQVNVLTKRFDPRVSSSQIFTLTEVNLSEPDPKLFLVPNYQMIKMPTANSAALSVSEMWRAQQSRPAVGPQAAR